MSHELASGLAGQNPKFQSGKYRSDQTVPYPYGRKANDRQISKIQKLVSDYDSFIKINHDRFDEEDFVTEFDEVTNEFITSIRKIKIGNPKTINRLIEIALDVSEENNNPHCKKKYSTKYGRRMLNTLYRQNKEAFLSNFIPSVSDM